MAGVGSWLVQLAGPAVRQGLVSAGIGVITFAGLNTAVSSALGAAKASLTGLPGDVTQLLAIAGVFTALSVLAGGFTAGVSLIAMKRLGKLT